MFSFWRIIIWNFFLFFRMFLDIYSAYYGTYLLDICQEGESQNMQNIWHNCYDKDHINMWGYEIFVNLRSFSDSSLCQFGRFGFASADIFRRCSKTPYDVRFAVTSLNPYPDSKVRGANMGPNWVLSAPDGPHVGPMNLAIWVMFQENSVAVGELTTQGAKSAAIELTM